MKKHYFLLFCAAIILCCASNPPREVEKSVANTGRETVFQALQPETFEGGLFSKSGAISTAVSSGTLNPVHPFKGLDPDNPAIASREFEMELEDGTLMGGLFFEYNNDNDDPKPLYIWSFGFLQDRWGTEAAKFYAHYLKNSVERLPAHVLILDHPTSGPFMANNGCLSIGTYDDARMWMEVARKLREDLCLTGIHLLGVSMSGQTVVHALIEDSRLGQNLFQSAMAVSIAPDFHQAPAKQLARLDTVKGEENPWKSYFKNAADKNILDKIQNQGLKMFINQKFIPAYQRVAGSENEFELGVDEIAVFLWDACEDRINRLRENPPVDWNPAFRLTNLDDFMNDTRIADLVQQVNKPLVFLSAFDDPAVEHEIYAEVMEAAEGNPWIAAYETPDGGHNGFDVVYGKDYLGRIMRLMMDPQILARWTDSSAQN